MSKGSKGIKVVFFSKKRIDFYLILFYISVINTNKGAFMKTAVIMKRKFFNGEIRQNSKTGFFSATDLVKEGNIWRAQNGLSSFKMSEWLRQKGTLDFITELERDGEKAKISGRGRGSSTWVHPYLFIDMALAINPKLKVEVYKWIYDELLKFRNTSGDSYKKMTGALYLAMSNKSKFKETVQYFAFTIRKECGVNNWQEATEQQLELRDKIHEYIALFSDIIREEKNLLNVSIKRAKEKMSAEQ